MSWHGNFLEAVGPERLTARTSQARCASASMWTASKLWVRRVAKLAWRVVRMRLGNQRSPRALEEPFMRQSPKERVEEAELPVEARQP